jgi:hypothetical protein
MLIETETGRDQEARARYMPSYTEVFSEFYWEKNFVNESISRTRAGPGQEKVARFEP